MAVAVAIVLAQALARGADAQTPVKPEGEIRMALYVTISPQWFDPGEVTGFITPFWLMWAMHDALVKTMPGKAMAPSLAESWTVSADGKVYDFKLREGLKFHNGDPFTADDVRFSFQRAKGYKILKEKVRDIEVVGPARVRVHLHEPWPDFMTFYGTMVAGAGWIVPKKYVEQVGDDGFLRRPVGLGPYKFVSHTPGIELVLEAFEGYGARCPR
jgi:peptide/nickel transport system substrate-binding protein